MTEVEEDAVAADVQLRALVQTLASSAPDAWRPDRRRATMEEANELLWTGREALRQDVSCSSRYAYPRLTSLYTQAIKLDMLQQQQGEEGSTTTAPETVDMIRQLCNQLLQSRQPRLVQKTADALATLAPQVLDRLIQLLRTELSSKEPLLVSAVALIARLETLSKGQTSSNELTDVLLQYSLSTFCPPEHVALASNCLSMEDATFWNETVTPALLLKVRSHAEKSLPVVAAWWKYYAPAECELSDEWIDVLLGPGKVSHAAARQLLGRSGRAASAVALRSPTPALRLIVWEIWGHVHTSRSDIPAVIEGIGKFLQKETKQREKGITVLVDWVVYARKGSSGYEKALTLVRSLGSDRGLLLSTMVDRIERSTLEAIICDLCKEKVFVSGIEKLVESAAANKKSTLRDGLVAAYAALVLATQSNGGTLMPVALKVLTKQPNSFVYSDSLRESLPGNSAMRVAFPRIVELLVQSSPSNAAIAETTVRALSCCVLYPPSQNHHIPDQGAINVAVETTNSVLCSFPNAAGKIVLTLLGTLNEASLQEEHLAKERQQTEEKDAPRKVVYKFDDSAVRGVAHCLSKRKMKDSEMAKVLLLMHVNTSGTGHQRTKLVRRCTSVLQSRLKQEEAVEVFSGEIANLACSSDLEEGTSSSDTVHMSACSLLSSLGRVASAAMMESETNFAKQSVQFLQHASKSLADKLRIVLSEIKQLSVDDVALHRSRPGTLFISSKEEAKTKQGQTGGKHLTADEEWDLQVRKELEAKKEKSQQSDLAAEASKLIPEQDARRASMDKLLNLVLVRANAAVVCLVTSDIEVGNVCLPHFSDHLIDATCSRCAACRLVQSVRSRCLDTLVALASCVYEIHEQYAYSMVEAVTTSVALSPLDDAAISNADTTTLRHCPPYGPSAALMIREMDAFGDVLAPGSFMFLFPVVRGCLTGPRTIAGTEAALRVLDRHTALLSEVQSTDLMSDMRREMAVCVLELLKHDRAQQFKDPSAIDTLSNCFQSFDSPISMTPAELSPLLDSRGALGTKNCRLGSMVALRRIADGNRKILKSNPLVENRIWLSCFSNDADVRREARLTWATVTEQEQLAKPSPLFSAPMFPLLSHSNASISSAAADAFAHAMQMHPGALGRYIENLCKVYIDAVPSDGDTVKKTDTPAKPVKPIPVAPKKKPVVSTGLPKRKPVAKKSALAIAGIGKPKTGKKKSALKNSALLKQKAERTLDQTELANQFGSPASKSRVEADADTDEKISVRRGVLTTLTATTKLPEKLELDESSLKMVASFLISFGIAESEPKVKGLARDTLRDIVASNGGSPEAVEFLLPQLETVLQSGVADHSSLGSLPTDKIPKTVSASDRRKEGAVAALGSVALHLKENEDKIDSIVDLLIGALKTPSEDVQLSVADALTKLMKKGKTPSRIEDLVTSFLRDCLQGDTLAVRRGGGYGLSAAVKGSGIATLKKFDVIKRLEEACSTGSSNEKEGALCAIELLSSRLGLLFEPHVIVLLPSLLKAFSDPSDHVREAALHTVGLIMSKLSAHGVKLVMPAVLTAFDDPSWRTKQASIHMLGKMSHLAPKQLASALPKVVPKLTEAFSDTHPKVKGSAQSALHEISTVVRNPEISSISTTLLKALTDPAEFTIKALEVLIATEFLHAIDAPSLALICPVLHRGLRDRGATAKRYAGLIAGNISTMISETKDLVPYLPTLLPDLQTALLDPIPDVRSTAAKALGSLTRSLGSQVATDLRPWLTSQLRNASCSSAERSGAAQGLTEVLIASGSVVVEEALRDEILSLRNHPEATTREGVLWVLSFLPAAMGQGFSPLIEVSLPALLKGLSDENEPVREVALRAGRVLIRSHGKVHVNKILPSLEIAMGDDDHRIRRASLALLGDLLSMIGGTTVLKGDGNTQDDVRRAEKAQAQIALALGSETRKRVLSGLYMARSDSVHAVRQMALQVWKTVVSVTARTLRDVLAVLVSRIVVDLASGDDDKTSVAGRCLGDVVGKLGDSVLPQIMPVLRNSLYEGDEHTKRGVCVGLTEVIRCSTRDQILRFIEIIIKVVQDAICDDSVVVRTVAATSFQSLHGVVGNRVFDEVVPSLMVALENGEHDEASHNRALHGLKGILSVRSRELLPYIIPRLIERPISTNHAQAIAAITEVTAETVFAHLSSVIPSLLSELSDCDDDTEKKETLYACTRALCRHIGNNGINALVGEVVTKCNSDKPSMRREACTIVRDLICERTEKSDLYEQIPILIRELLYRLKDADASVLKANHAALTALSKNIPAEELVKHVEFMTNLLLSMVSDARRRKGGVGDGEFLLAGFNIPKGVEPFIPIFSRGLLFGNSSIREISASGMGEVISLTSTRFLAGPIIVKMTGPLLRIVGDRNPANVKIAILKTLGKILVKGGPSLRAFVPQFQTTFVKALADPSRQVRVDATGALALLMPLSTRVDPLIKELVAAALGKNLGEDALAAAAVQTATFEALAVVLKGGGKKSKVPEIIPSALDASIEMLTASDAGVRESAAKVLGAASELLGWDKVESMMTETLLPAMNSSSTGDRHGAACAIQHVLASEVGIHATGILEDLNSAALSLLDDDNALAREAGSTTLVVVAGRASDPSATFKGIESVLLKLLTNSREPVELHKAVAKGLCIALSMMEPGVRIKTLGLKIVDACLKLAMSGTQKVQFAFNDVLWLTTDVAGGQDGLDEYAGIAQFDHVKAMKSIHSKVLSRMTEASCLAN